jgi:membrane associated rhomboid family serine protease
MPGGEPASVPPGIREAVRPRDLLALAVVPVVLLAVAALPVARRRALVLSHTEPTLLTAYTSHFVHLADWHLAANVAAYAVLAGVGYLLSVASGARRRYFVAWVAFLVAVPVALSGLTLVSARPRVSYGFSGVNMAFMGYLGLALAGYCDTRLDGLLRCDQAPLLFFLGLAVITVLAVEVPVVRVGVAAAASLSGLLYLRRLRGPVAVLDSGRLSGVADRVGEFELGLAGLVVFLVWPLLAFPASPVVDGVLVNTYAHLLGYSLGFIASYLTFGVAARAGSWTPPSRSPAR